MKTTFDMKARLLSGEIIELSNDNNTVSLWFQVKLNDRCGL